VFYQAKVLEDKPISYFEGASSGYLSLVSESQKLATVGNGWSFSGCTTAEASFNPPTIDLSEQVPAPGSVTKITNSSTAGTRITLTSPALGKMKDFKAGVGVTAGFYWRATPMSVAIEITMQYNNGSWVDIGTTYVPVPKVINASWIYFSHTFRLDTFASALKNEDYRFVIASTDKSPGLPIEYIYYMNGFSVGQKSEAIASVDPGASGPYTVASLSGGPATLSVDKYNGLLTAVNSGIPLHRSLSSATLLEPYLPERPSMTLAKSGFMQAPNKKDIVTLEFWLKVGAVPNSPVRIAGPVGEKTGLYLNGTTLTLSISNTEVGYDLGTIDYPMLIDWVVCPLYSTVLVNGDAVINVFQAVNTSQYSVNGEIGFYTNQEVHPVYVSSIATYQYSVPSTVAKIRFVRGQGTEQYGITASRYDGVSHSADFSTSEFATNLSYPDNARWNRGYYRNLTATDMLTLPNYEMPEMERQSISQDWSALNNAMFGKPLPAAGYSSDVFPLDISTDDTTGTSFTNQASNGNVFTTQTLASQRVSKIDLPLNWIAGTKITISGEAKFSGTAPQLTVKFNGPDITYTSSFAATQPKSMAAMTYTIPAGTTSVTWGLKTTGGTTSAQFNEVYAKLTYPQQPFYIKPTGYTTEPYLYWHALNFLESERTAAVLTRMAVGTSPASATDLLTIRKRNAETKLRAYLNGTSLVYEYVDYKGATVLATKTVNANTHFNVGFDFDALVAKYPNMATLLGSPANLEVLVGGGTTNSFAGGVYHVSFYNEWHHKTSANTYTNGLADTMAASTPSPVVPATYTLAAVTSYGNFSLDVLAAGYWQETLPVSLFTKEVADSVGVSKQALDFIQATVGKTRANPLQSGTAAITYFQLINRYWARSYADLASDYSTYTDLNNVMLPVYDPSSLDLQTWVSLHKMSDAPVDYTQKTAMSFDGSSTTYLEDNGYRHFVQDGYSIVIPYSYDQKEYALTFYHLLSSRGQRSSPVKLKSFELASWASDQSEWKAIGTQEGNNAYPYAHNGSYFVTDFPSVFEITKRGFNYLYKSNRSGFKPKSVPITGYDCGVAFGWKRNGNKVEPRTVAGVSAWVLLDAQSLPQATKIMSVTAGANQICYVDAVPIENGTRYALQVKTATGAYTNAQWFVNGNMTGAPILRAGEWNVLQLAFVKPVDSEGEQVYVRTSGNTNFAFDHVTIHGQLNAKISGVATYRTWNDLTTPTPPANQWQAWGAYTWFSLYDMGTTLIVDVMFDDMVSELTGTGVSGRFTSSFGTEFKEIFVLRDIEWVSVPVITK
jgi:hypothetical protein